MDKKTKALIKRAIAQFENDLWLIQSLRERAALGADVATCTAAEDDIADLIAELVAALNASREGE